MPLERFITSFTLLAVRAELQHSKTPKQAKSKL